MKSLLLTTAILALLAVSMTQAQGKKKYDLKSGTITFETTMTMMGMEIKKKYVLYFDDYGMKECKETLDDDGKVKERFLSDGKDLFDVLFEQKEAYKRGKATRGTEMRFDWNEVSEKDKKAGIYKKLANVKAASKDCEAFEMNDRGTTTTFAGWNHINLLVDQKSDKMKSLTRAVKIEENVTVPAEKFQIPAGFAVK